MLSPWLALLPAACLLCTGSYLTYHEATRKAWWCEVMLESDFRSAEIALYASSRYFVGSLA